MGGGDTQFTQQHRERREVNIQGKKDSVSISNTFLNFSYLLLLFIWISPIFMVSEPFISQSVCFLLKKKYWNFILYLFHYLVVFVCFLLSLEYDLDEILLFLYTVKFKCNPYLNNTNNKIKTIPLVCIVVLGLVFSPISGQKLSLSFLISSSYFSISRSFLIKQSK